MGVRWQKARLTKRIPVFKRRAKTLSVMDSKLEKMQTLVLLKLTIKMAKATLVSFWKRHKVASRLLVLFMVFVILFSLFYDIFARHEEAMAADYKTLIKQLLGNSNSLYASRLKRDAATGIIHYNEGYTPGSDLSGDTSSPKFSADFNAKGTVKVDDAVNQTSISFTPTFAIADPIVSENRVIYPLRDENGFLVYTLKSSTIKQDIVFLKRSKDQHQYEFDINMPEGLEMRSESNGSVGIYGLDNQLISSSVSTATSQDAELLANARKNGEKSRLVFTFPAPFINESGTKTGLGRVWYEVHDTKLVLYANGLKNASYPLSIDPTIYIETARKLMRGNNETNVDFDTTNDLIQKSQTTGARIDYWSDSTEMSTGVWDQAMTSAGGFVYRAGGRVDPTMPYVVSQQATSSTSTLNFVMNMPTVRPAGDLYVAIISRVGTATITAPASWSSNCTTTRENMTCWKIGTDQGGGNEASTYTWSVASGVEWVGTILRIKNFNSGSPISGTIGTGSSASAAIPAFPAVTPSHDATLIIRSVSINADKPTEATWMPSGHTRLYSGTSSQGASSVGLAVAYLDVPPLATNAAAAANFVSDGILNDTYGASSLAIRPATVTAGVQSTVEWAQFNTGSSTIDSPNPGAGTCSGWCTDSAYNLPAGRIGMSMFAYNGFLYAVGGSTDLTAANAQNTVWIAKLGANGEPQLWHPSGGTATYWYVASNTLPSARSYTSIVAYNNKLYLVGGRDTSGNSISTVHSTDILPTGDITSWTTTNMQDLTTPNARHGHSVHVYNGYMYIVAGMTTTGGGSSNTFRDTVYYSKLSSTGAMSAWTQTSSLTTDSGAYTAPRASFGGQISTIQGGYLYVGGGCTAVTNGFCSTITADMQLSSINADGSLAGFNRIQNLYNQRMGYTLMTWQGGLYRFGGCNRQNTGVGVGTCYAVHQTADYGVVNPAGDASTVRNSTKTGRGTCLGSSPTNCNIPDAGDSARQVGQMSSMTVINNGYIYIIGGCAVAANPGTCSNMSGNTAYSSISSTGVLVRPTTCNGSYGTNLREVGVITQSGTAVTGSGTDFDSSIVGRTVIYEDNTTGTVSSVASATSMAMSGSKTISTVQKYSFGITKSGTTITGGDGRWTSSIVGSVLVYADGTTANVTAYTSATQITVDGSHADFGTAQRYGFEGNWCVDSTNQLNGTSGVGAGSAAVFNNTIYVVGGTNGSGTWNANINRVLLNADGSLSGSWTSQGPGTTSGLTGLPTGSFPATSSSGIGYSYVFTRANPASAGTNPGNLYILGGCTGSGGIGCTTTEYSSGVYKCNIAIGGEIATNSCSTTSQLQIDPDGASNDGAGLGLMAGTVYANRIYLIGGACEAQSSGSASNPCGSTYRSNRKDTIYAAIDSSNNIVDAVTTDSDTWKLTTAQMSPIRRRGTALGYNGYIYSLAGYNDTTTSLQDLLFSKVDVSTGDALGANGGSNFDSSGVVVTPRWDLKAIVSNGYVYAIGGCGGSAAAPTCSSYTEPTVQTFQLYNNDSGTPISFNASANQFGTDRMGASSTILNGYLYVAGGCTSTTDCTTASSSVQYTQLDQYGTLSNAWSAGGSLPAVRAWGQLEAVGGTLYYIGGQDSTSTNEQLTVYYTTSISSGNPTWSGTAATNGLPAERTKFSASVWDSRIYVTGGLNNAAAVTNTVYVSPKLTSGGNITSAWTTSTAFNVARSGLSTVAYANNLYIMGGTNGTQYLNDVQYASIGYKTGSIQQSGTSTVTGTGTSWTSAMIGSTLQYRDGETATILTVPSGTSMTVSVSKTVTAGTGYTILDGSVGSWSYTTSLPEPISQADSFAANGYIYLVGGRSSDGDCVPNTLLAPISANTTIATGNNATGVGEWYETNMRYTGDRYGNTVSYYGGRMYIMGGACEKWPTVTSVSRQSFGTDTTSHNVTMPSTVDVGDLLIVLLTTDGGTASTVTTPAGWTLPTNGTQTEGTNVRGSVFVKDAAGTEDGTNVDFVTSATEQAAAQVYRIPASNWEGNIASVEVANVAGSSTNAPNPPSLNPGGWDVENTLWINYVAASSYASVTTYPTSTTNQVHTTAGSGNTGATVSSSRRESRAASEDPVAYAMPSTSSSTSFTIAVRPAAFAYTSGNRTIEASVYSQPQVAIYSRMIDTDTDVFPTSWLMNGLDNSIGARWRMTYSSAVNGVWWNGSWGSRKKITFDNSLSSDNLIDFPVRISLSSSNIDYSKTQNAGQDIRFVDSDGVTPLSYEIEKWDEAGTSEVWVKVPQIDATSSSDYIYMYYNNGSATDGQSVNNTWNSAYKGVYHLKEALTSSCSGSDEACDSTSNANNMNAGSSMTGADSVTGQIGNGMDFDGTVNDVLSKASPSNFPNNTAAKTVTYWFKYSSAPASAKAMVQLHNTSGPGSYYGFHNLTGCTGYSLGTWRGGGPWFVCTTNPSTGAWHQYTYTFDGTTSTMYLDGSYVTSSTQAPNASGSITNFNIGADPIFGTEHFTGQMDEVRVADVARSSSWAIAEYRSMNNLMNTFSAEELAMGVWGQATNYGEVTLGDVATYTPKDSSGTNTNYARYYYFYVSIDASQTFGYPEDVNRGPTISDLTLFFTSDPSKRLRHGKTFTGGEQQPLDAPCRQSVDAQCPLP